MVKNSLTHIQRAVAGHFRRGGHFVVNPIQQRLPLLSQGMHPDIAQFVNADTFHKGVNIILAVTQRGDERQVQTR